MAKFLQMIKRKFMENFVKIFIFAVVFLLIAIMIGFRYALSIITLLGVYLFFEYSSKNPFLSFKKGENDVEEKAETEYKNKKSKQKK